MRRRHVQTIREEERPTLLLMAAGAAVGAAAGLYLGRRYRSMDAFVEDVRDKFESLRDVWYEAESLSNRRERLAVDETDDIEDDDVGDEYDDVEDDDLDDTPYETEEAYHEEVFDDEDDLDDDDLEDDGLGDDDLEDDATDDGDLEEELAAVARDNGAAEASQRAADAAQQLEERVLSVMHDDPVLRSRSIEIAVVGDGVVELTGTVHSIEEVSRAAAEVRRTPGVSMVLNRLEVRAGGTLDTASVAREPASE